MDKTIHSHQENDVTIIFVHTVKIKKFKEHDILFETNTKLLLKILHILYLYLYNSKLWKNISVLTTSLSM